MKQHPLSHGQGRDSSPKGGAKTPQNWRSNAAHIRGGGRALSEVGGVHPLSFAKLSSSPQGEPLASPPVFLHPAPRWNEGQGKAHVNTQTFSLNPVFGLLCFSDIMRDFLRAVKIFF